jgi:ribosomal protein S18 acetylase RimI-like enzyme
MTTITDRPYAGHEDFWPVRDFLTELWRVVPPGFSWEIRRWDGSNCHTTTPGLDPARTERTRLWEADGRIVAAAMHEGGRELHPNVRPEYVHLTERVVAWGEETAARLGDDRVFLHCWDYDVVSRRIVGRRGYEETDGWGIAYRGRFGRRPIPEPEVPAGYTVRATEPTEADDQGIADLLNATFRRDLHVAEDHRAFSRNAPSFRRDLDLVAVAEDGTLAAYAAVCWDGANRNAIFEPVGTHPDHRRRGLAKALMLEGLHRSHRLGAATFEVATGDLDPANALYASLPFTEVYRGRFWRKDL